MNFLKDMLPVIAFYPAWCQYLFGVTMLLVATSLIVFTINYKAADDSKNGIADDKGLPALVKSARDHQQKYALESVVMIVRPDNAFYESGKHEASVDVRNIYTVYAREDMTVADFREEFRSQVAKGIDSLPGSEVERPEENLDNDKKWWVDVPLKKGERRTIVTAARYHYSLPLAEGRVLHGLHIGPNQDAWCYDNDTDIIGQLTIMVESSVPLDAPGVTDDIRVESATGELVPQGTVVRNHNDKNEGYALVGTWHNVLPNQNCVLRVRYQPISGTRFADVNLRPAA
jgi:hypothetical protein